MTGDGVPVKPAHIQFLKMDDMGVFRMDRSHESDLTMPSQDYSILIVRRRERVASGCRHVAGGDSGW
jgi:hypothetical protein